MEALATQSSRNRSVLCMLAIGGGLLCLWLCPRAGGRGQAHDLCSATAVAMSSSCDRGPLRSLLVTPPIGEVLDRVAFATDGLLGDARDLVARTLHTRRPEALVAWQVEPGRRQARAAAFALAFHYEPLPWSELHAIGDASERAAVEAVAHFLLPDSIDHGAQVDPRHRTAADRLFAAAIEGQRDQGPRWRAALEANDGDERLAALLRDGASWCAPIAFAEHFASADLRVRARAVFAASCLWCLPLPLGVADAALPMRNAELRGRLADRAQSHRGFRDRDIPALLAQFAGDLDHFPWHLVASTHSLDGDGLERLADGLLHDVSPLRLPVHDLPGELGSAAPFLVRTRDAGLLRTLFVASLGDAGYRLVVRRATTADPSTLPVLLAGLYLAPLPSPDGLVEATELAARCRAAANPEAAGIARLLAMRCGADLRLPAPARNRLQLAFTDLHLPSLENGAISPENLEAAWQEGGERATAAWRELHAEWLVRPLRVLEIVRQGRLRHELAAVTVADAGLSLPQLAELVPTWTHRLALWSDPLVQACERAPQGDPSRDLEALQSLTNGAPWPVRLVAAQRAADLGGPGRIFATAILANAVLETDKIWSRRAAGVMLGEGLQPPDPPAFVHALRQPPVEWHDAILAEAMLVRFVGQPLAGTGSEVELEVALQSGAPFDESTWRTLLSNRDESHLLRLLARDQGRANAGSVRIAAIRVAAERPVWTPWFERGIANLLEDSDPSLRLAAYRALRTRDPAMTAAAWLPYAAVFDPDPAVRSFGESLSR